MTSLPSWTPSSRPPALDIWSKYGISSPSSLDSALAAGALSPDVQPNSPPSFVVHQPTAPAAPSLMMIGNYVLTDRLPDMSPGVAVYKAVHVVLREEFLCRILPLDRCHTSLTPFYTVGPHPHINGVHEVVMGATSAYAMHRAASTAASTSEDLHAYVRRRRRLPELEAARLFAQALQAVAHCHRNGVIVRDIKLRRFVLSDVQRTNLQLDGLYDAVLFHDGNDRLTDKHGCLAYVSPEILDATFTAGTAAASETAASSRTPSAAPGCYAGRAADMWSLGVMLYTMLVGRYPFADTDACALFARIRRGRYLLPSEISLSAQARCLVRSLLAVSPSDRVTAEEALRHPWFAAAKIGADPAEPPLLASAANDHTVPEAMEEGKDEFFVELG